MGRFSAHVAILRRNYATNNELEILLQRRSGKVLQGGCYGLPGGGLTRNEEKWSKVSSLEDSKCWLARWRAALRETAEECGGGVGPDLVPVTLPNLEGSPDSAALLAEGCKNARLPACLVGCSLTSLLANALEIQVSGYVHFFFFILLEEEAAKHWKPRAVLDKRWEIDESAPCTTFGYAWVTVSELARHPGQPVQSTEARLCTWIQPIFSQHSSLLMQFSIDAADRNAIYSEALRTSTKEDNGPEAGVAKYEHSTQTPDRPALVSVSPKASASIVQKNGLRSFEDVYQWLERKLDGIAVLTLSGDSRCHMERAVGLSNPSVCCRWAVECEDITTALAIERYVASSPTGATMLCFHGTSHASAVQIAQQGFDPQRRCEYLAKIVPYLVGEYFSSDANVSLKYSRQKEEQRNTLSMLLVEMPASHFEIRNGVWFRPANRRENSCGVVDESQSTTFVSADASVVVPRALLTFKPSAALSWTTNSAMVCYDAGLQSTPAGNAAWDTLMPFIKQGFAPSAVLFDLDFTCWPFAMSMHTNGPPFVPVPSGFAVTDCSGKRLSIHKDVAEILCTLHHAQIPIVLCSRSPAPRWCREAIANISITPKSCSELKFVDVINNASIIRPAQSKLKHLQDIQTCLDVPFDRMLFFDDEKRICDEAKRLGVRCVHVDPSGGVTKAHFAEGLDLFLPGREPPKPAGKALAFLALLRSEDGRVETMEIFVQKRGSQLVEHGTYCLPGGFLEKGEEEWAQQESVSEESRCVARWRAALRETALDCGGGEGPGLVPVHLPMICEPPRHGALKTEVQAVAKLPGGFRLEACTLATSTIELKVGDYTHHFFFQPLSMESTRGWYPATSRRRVRASDHKWVPLASLLTDPAQPIAARDASLCSWVQEFLRSCRDQIEELISLIPKTKFSHEKHQGTHHSDRSSLDTRLRGETTSIEAESCPMPDVPPNSSKPVSPKDGNNMFHFVRNSPKATQRAVPHRLSRVNSAPRLKASSAAVYDCSTAAVVSRSSKYQHLKQMKSSRLPPIGQDVPVKRAGPLKEPASTTSVESVS